MNSDGNMINCYLNSKSFMKRIHQAILLALMMATMSLAGCFGGDDKGSDEDETPVETLEDWPIHFASTASDLPECNDNRDGWLYYVSTDENFQVCTQNGWEIIDITGPSGANGTNGTDGVNGANGIDGIDGTNGMDGANGADGINGQDGANGQDGTDGISPIIRVLSSTSCTTGGNTFEIGYDNNGDGVLDLSEVVYEVDICNGEDGERGDAGQDGIDGQDGADGQDGSDGQSGASSSTLLTDISSTNSSVCDAGGRIIKHGLDNGDGNGIAQNNILESGEVDYSTTFCSKYRIEKLGNNPSSSNSPAGNSFVEFKGELYYAGYVNSTPCPICKTDGTVEGTTIAIHQQARELTVFNDTLIFFVSNWDSSNLQWVSELWSSDGTVGGTTLIKNLSSGYPHSFTAVGDKLFFVGGDGTPSQGNALWVTDTTPNGTQMVKDIHSATGGANTNSVQELFAFNDTLIFLGNDAINGYELWKSDGTANGTQMVKDINPVQLFGSPGDSIPRKFTKLGNSLYFKANDGTNGTELWKTDGTLNGTELVKDVNPGALSGLSNTDIILLNDQLYFKVYNGSHQLWKSDGTPNGTMMVSALGGNSFGGDSFCIVGDKFYFTAYGASHGNELWVSDGSLNGTFMVKDINPGPSYGVGSGTNNPFQLAVDNNLDLLYFSGDDGTNGKEIWVTDGTAAGTNMAANFNSNLSGIVTSYAYDTSWLFGGKLFINILDGNVGNLVIAELSDDGTIVLLDDNIIYQ